MSKCTTLRSNTRFMHWELFSWFWVGVTAASDLSSCLQAGLLSRGDRALAMGLALVCVTVCFVSNLVSEFRRLLPPGSYSMGDIHI